MSAAPRFLGDAAQVVRRAPARWRGRRAWANTPPAAIAAWAALIVLLLAAVPLTGCDRPVRRCGVRGQIVVGADGQALYLRTHYPVEDGGGWYQQRLPDGVDIDRLCLDLRGVK